MKWHQLAWSGCASLASGLVSLALWTLWLGLALLIGVQAYVASTSQLEAPRFVMRAVERRLELSGIHAAFGRTIFDPSGRVLFENAVLRLPGIEEPVITAKGVFIRLNPWAIAAGRFEPVELRVTGVSLRVPAMVSPTGQADEVVHDLDAEFVPRGEELEVQYLNFRLGNVRISAHGAVHLSVPGNANGSPLPLAEFLARNYAGLSREFDDVVETLSILDQPLLRVELTPSEASGAVAGFELFANGLSLDSPLDIQTSGLEIRGAFPFVSRPGVPLSTTLDFSTGELDLPRGIVASGVHALLHVRLPPGRLIFDRDAFHDIQFSAAGVSGGGLIVRAPLASIVAGPLPRLRVGLRALLFDTPESFRSDVDVQAGTARVRFEGGLPAGLLGPLGKRLGRDLRKYADFTEPIAAAGEARFGPGWKFQRASARVAARGATVWHVPLDEVRGRVEFDGRRLVAPELYLRLGDSFARGRYEQNVATREYRYILDGALRPAVIGPWFPGQSWWHEFFRPFAFPGPPPTAKADVRGSWANGRKTIVFVAVDSLSPVYRGVAFDRLRARLFIGPGFDEGLDFRATSGSRTAAGEFSRRYDLTSGVWQSVDIDLASTYDVPSAAALLGPRGASILEPFAFDHPPVATFKGRFDGPASKSGIHSRAKVEARSDGPFRFHDFPFESVDFEADVRDDKIVLDRFKAAFAGGTVTGSGTVAGRGAGQRVDFAASIEGARLGRAIGLVDDFAARRAHRPPRPLTKFVKEKSGVLLDISASGAGLSGDLLSYHGGGKASIEGAELGEVRLFGLFTELLPFASLRFTSARADFKIDGPQLVFSDVNVTGANSAIQAHGTYAIDRHQLDFKAKFFPFKKSRSLPQVLIGGVLTPFSEFLEVRLTGSVENPSWEFEHGPSNLLQGLAAPGPATPGTGDKR